MANIKEILYQNGLYDDVISVIDDYRFGNKDYWKSKYTASLNKIKWNKYSFDYLEQAIIKNIRCHIKRNMKDWTKERIDEYFKQENYEYVDGYGQRYKESMWFWTESDDEKGLDHIYCVADYIYANDLIDCCCVELFGETFSLNRWWRLEDYLKETW